MPVSATIGRDALLRLLAELATRLDDAQVALLVKMAEAMGVTIQRRISPDSDILRHNFQVSFSNQLLVFHATNAEKLNKKAFEYLFKYACEADGKSAVITPNTTLAGADVIVGKLRFSLKTQADSGINARGIYIQKFMEARWLRDCPDCGDIAREATRRITEHLSHYDRILVLRAFDLDEGHVRYELLEIPKALLMRVGRLTASDFSAKNKAGSSGANVLDEKGKAFRILLDGSVEKVRIFNLQVDRCTFHGEWIIPRVRATPDDDDQDE